MSTIIVLLAVLSILFPYIFADTIYWESDIILVTGSGSRTWTSSRSYCTDTIDTNLASITSSSIQTQLQNLYDDANLWYDSIWIGLNDRSSEGTYKWEDGSTYSYSYWKSGQPNNGAWRFWWWWFWGNEDCVRGVWSSQRWYDSSCGYKLPYFACNRPPLTEWTNDKVIMVVDTDTRRNWYACETYCEDNYGSFLASFHSASDAQAMRSLQTTYYYSSDWAWAGLNDQTTEGTWQWIDGSDVDYSFTVGWTNTGSEDCALFHRSAAYYGYAHTCDYSVYQFHCNILQTFESDLFAFVFSPNMPLNYDQANTYCENYHSAGLASIHTQDALDELVALIDSSDADSTTVAYTANTVTWIGLNDMTTEGDWSDWADGSHVKYSNWNTGEPNDYGSGEDCAEMRNWDGLWNDNSCSVTRKQFACNKDKVYSSDSYLVVNTGDDLTWEEGEEYCQNRFDTHLASVFSESDYDNMEAVYLEMVSQYTDSPHAWVGLNDISSEGTYTWIDGSTSTDYQPWASGEPNNWRSWWGGGEDCAELRSSKTGFNDLRCWSSAVDAVVCNRRTADILESSDSNYWIVHIDSAITRNDAQYFCESRFGSSLASFVLEDDVSNLMASDSVVTTYSIVGDTWTAFSYGNKVLETTLGTSYSIKFDMIVYEDSAGFWRNMFRVGSDSLGGYGRMPGVWYGYSWNYIHFTARADTGGSWSTAQISYNSFTFSTYTTYEMEYYVDLDEHNQVSRFEMVMDGVSYTIEITEDMGEYFATPDKIVGQNAWFMFSDWGTTPNGAYKNLEITMQLGQGRSWVGLTDSASEGTWEYDDGSPADYVPWHDNEPAGSADCAAFRWADAGVSEYDCSDETDIDSFICNVEPATITQSDNYWMAGFSSAITATDAEDYCYTRFGTALGTVVDASDTTEVYDAYDFLYDEGYSGKYYWLGLNDEETAGTYVWRDGSTSDYTNWASGEPNDSGSSKDCAVGDHFLLGQNNDASCSNDGSVQGVLCNKENTSIHPTDDGDYYLVRFTEGTVTWDEAEEYCQGRFGTHLASFFADDEMTSLNTAMDDLQAIFNDVTMAWIGLSGTTDAYTWADGSPARYFNWADDGELTIYPDEDSAYVSQNAENGEFNDATNAWELHMPNTPSTSRDWGLQIDYPNNFMFHSQAVTKMTFELYGERVTTESDMVIGINVGSSQYLYIALENDGGLAVSGGCTYNCIHPSTSTGLGSGDLSTIWSNGGAWYSLHPRQLSSDWSQISSEGFGNVWPVDVVLQNDPIEGTLIVSVYRDGDQVGDDLTYSEAFDSDESVSLFVSTDTSETMYIYAVTATMEGVGGCTTYGNDGEAPGYYHMNCDHDETVNAAVCNIDPMESYSTGTYIVQYDPDTYYSWQDAEDLCEHRYGTTLASIGDSDSQTEIYNQITADFDDGMSGAVWMGLIAIDDTTPEWSDSTEWLFDYTFANFEDGLTSDTTLTMDLSTSTSYGDYITLPGGGYQDATGIAVQSVYSGSYQQGFQIELPEPFRFYPNAVTTLIIGVQGSKITGATSDCDMTLGISVNDEKFVYLFASEDTGSSGYGFANCGIYPQIANGLGNDNVLAWTGVYYRTLYTMDDCGSAVYNNAWPMYMKITNDDVNKEVTIQMLQTDGSTALSNAMTYSEAFPALEAITFWAAGDGNTETWYATQLDLDISYATSGELCGVIRYDWDGYWDEVSCDADDLINTFVCNYEKSLLEYESENFVFAYWGATITWTDAEEYCETEWDTNLGSILIATMESEITALIDENKMDEMSLDEIWMGYYQLDGETDWTWSDDEPNLYTNWDGSVSTISFYGEDAGGVFAYNSGSTWKHAAASSSFNSWICNTEHHPHISYLNYYYFVYRDEFVHSWNYAEDYCVDSFNSHLAPIHSLLDNQDATTLIDARSRFPSSGTVWTGYSEIDSEGTFEWVCGSDSIYENFASSFPDTDNTTITVDVLSSQYLVMYDSGSITLTNKSEAGGYVYIQNENGYWGMSANLPSSMQFYPNQKTTVSFEIYGESITEELDLLYGFSVNSDSYILMMHEQDGNMVTGDGTGYDNIIWPRNEGVGGPGIMTGADIETAYDGVNVRTTVTDWSTIEEDGGVTGDLWPVQWVITNDPVNDEAHVTLYRGGDLVGDTYSYSSSFPTAAPISLFISTDESSDEEVYIDYITVEMTAEDDCVAFNPDTSDWDVTDCAGGAVTHGFMCQKEDIVTFESDNYFLVHSETRDFTWQEAEDYCESRFDNFTHLASIRASEYQAEIESLFAAHSESWASGAWFGGYDVESDSLFYFADGIHTFYDYTNWGSNEPSSTDGSQCMSLDTSDFTWATEDCSTSHATFVCTNDYSIASIESDMYILVYTPEVTYDFHQAEEYCRDEFDTNMTSILSKYMNFNLMSFVETVAWDPNVLVNESWIGFVYMGSDEQRSGDRTGHFEWTDGSVWSSFDYDKWDNDNGEPNVDDYNQDCTYFQYGNRGRWASARCTYDHIHSFLCNTAGRSYLMGTSYSYYILAHPQESGLSWATAESFCEGYFGTHLASIKTVFHQDDMRELIDFHYLTIIDKFDIYANEIWIGLKQSEYNNYKYEWSDNSDVFAEYWSSATYPDGIHCDQGPAYVDSPAKLQSGYYLVDESCNYRLNFSSDGVLILYQYMTGTAKEVWSSDNENDRYANAIPPYYWVLSKTRAEHYIFDGDAYVLWNSTTDSGYQGDDDVGSDSFRITLLSNRDVQMTLDSTDEIVWRTNTLTSPAPTQMPSDDWTETKDLCAMVRYDLSFYWTTRDCGVNRPVYACNVNATWIRHESENYYLISTDDYGAYNWSMAEEYCVDTYGTHLASIMSQADEDEILDLIINASRSDAVDNAWIGYYYSYTHQKFRWTDGSSINYTNFETDEDHITTDECTSLHDDDEIWYANDCGETFNAWVCNALPIQDIYGEGTNNKYVAVQFEDGDYWNEFVNWDQAQTVCNAIFGTTIATITSWADYSKFEMVCPADTECWLGVNTLSSDGEKWDWDEYDVEIQIDEENFGETDWPWALGDPDEPNTHTEVCEERACRCAYSYNGWWVKGRCSDGKEKWVICNNDTSQLTTVRDGTNITNSDGDILTDSSGEETVRIEKIMISMCDDFETIIFENSTLAMKIQGAQGQSQYFYIDEKTLLPTPLEDGSRSKTFDYDDLPDLYLSDLGIGEEVISVSLQYDGKYPFCLSEMQFEVGYGEENDRTSDFYSLNEQLGDFGVVFAQTCDNSFYWIEESQPLIQCFDNELNFYFAKNSTFARQSYNVEITSCALKDSSANYDSSNQLTFALTGYQSVGDKGFTSSEMVTLDHFIPGVPTRTVVWSEVGHLATVNATLYKDTDPNKNRFIYSPVIEKGENRTLTAILLRSNDDQLGDEITVRYNGSKIDATGMYQVVESNPYYDLIYVNKTVIKPDTAIEIEFKSYEREYDLRKATSRIAVGDHGAGKCHRRKVYRKKCKRFLFWKRCKTYSVWDLYCRPGRVKSWRAYYYTWYGTWLFFFWMRRFTVARTYTKPDRVRCCPHLYYGAVVVTHWDNMDNLGWDENYDTSQCIELDDYDVIGMDIYSGSCDQCQDTSWPDNAIDDADSKNYIRAITFFTPEGDFECDGTKGVYDSASQAGVQNHVTFNQSDLGIPDIIWINVTHCAFSYDDVLLGMDCDWEYKYWVSEIVSQSNDDIDIDDFKFDALLLFQEDAEFGKMTYPMPFFYNDTGSTWTEAEETCKNLYRSHLLHVTDEDTYYLALAMVGYDKYGGHADAATGGVTYFSGREGDTRQAWIGLNARWNSDENYTLGLDWVGSEHRTISSELNYGFELDGDAATDPLDCVAMTERDEAFDSPKFDLVNCDKKLPFLCGAFPWRTGTTKVFVLNLETVLHKVAIASIGTNGNGLTDAFCVDAVTIDGALSKRVDPNWIGSDSAPECETQVCAVASFSVMLWPSCNLEVIDMSVDWDGGGATVGTAEAEMIGMTCTNYNRYDYVSCSIEQAFEFSDEMSYEVANYQESTNEMSEAYSWGYSEETSYGSDTTTTSSTTRHFELGGSVEFGTKFAGGAASFSFGIEVGGGWEWGDSTENSVSYGVSSSQEWNYETSQSHSETVGGSTSESFTTTESSSIACSADVDVPPSHELSYGLVFEQVQTDLVLLSDIKITLCSAYVSDASGDESLYYIYIYDIPSGITSSKMTECSVQFNAPEYKSNDLTCIEDQKSSFLEGAPFVAVCNDDENELYDGCQCQNIDSLTEAVCICTDTGGNPNPYDTSETIVSDNWEDTCRALDCPDSKYNSTQLLTPSPTDSSATPSPTEANSTGDAFTSDSSSTSGLELISNSILGLVIVLCIILFCCLGGCLAVGLFYARKGEFPSLDALRGDGVTEKNRPLLDGDDSNHHSNISQHSGGMPQKVAMLDSQRHLADIPAGDDDL